MKWLYAIFAGLSIICLSFLVLNWMVNGDPAELFFHTRIHQPSVGVIRSLDIEFKDHEIFFDIHTVKQLTCEEIIRELGVSHLTLKKKIFSPACSHLSPTHIRIVYRESPQL